jgi:hypothetical protein
MRAKVVGAALLPLLFSAGMAAAQENKCAVADYYVEPYFKAAKAATALRATKSLEILVLSSAPSQMRTGDKLRSYPTFLEAALKEQLPDYNIRVTIHAEPRRSIKEILPVIPKVLADTKPTLVVWQTGTVEAFRGVDPDKFERKLEAGIELIRKANADVILVNPQFSPRTAIFNDSGALNERIRRVSSYADVPLFNRYDIMRSWHENEAFDLTALKNDGSYEAIHRCLGRLLAEYISRAASFAEIAKLRQ